MKNLKLFDILTSFSEEEVSGFDNFLAKEDAVSPRKFRLLLEEIRTAAIRGGLNKLDLISVFKKVYGKESYSYQTIKNRQSELLRLAEKFLVQVALERDRLKKEYYLMEELQRRNLLGRYGNFIRKTENALNENIFDESLHEKASSFYITKSRYHHSVNDPHTGFEAFFRHTEIFINNFLNNFFREGFEYLVKKSLSIKYDFNPVLELADSLKGDSFFAKLEELKRDADLLPIIRYCLYRGFKEPDKQFYIKKANELYFANEKKFSEWFKTDVYRMLMSYYLIKINAGESKYYKDLFILYKKKLRQNLISDISQDTYPSNVFREYVIVALKQNDYKWAEKFINKYVSLLPPDVRNDEYSLARIRILFAKNEFKETLELIKRTRSDNFLHYIDIARFRLMTYYELSMAEEAFPEAERLKHYLKSNRNIPRIDAANTRRFLDRYLSLLKITLDPDRKDKDIFLIEMKNMKEHVPSKDWITEKIKKL